MSWVITGWAQEAAGERVLRELAEFWAAPVADREAGLAYDFEVEVLVYDREWAILHVQDASLAEYLQVEAMLPIESGQRVRLQGRTVAPGGVFTIRDPVVTVVGEAAIAWEPVTFTVEGLRSKVNHPISFAGLVLAQGFAGEDHLELDMVVDGKRSRVWVLVDPTEPVPTLAGQYVRVNAVGGARFDGLGNLTAADAFCPSLEQVEALGSLAEQALFAGLATPLEELREHSEHARVKVEGQVVRISPEGHPFVRDASGQVEVVTEQPVQDLLGRKVEVVGVPRGEGLTLRLTQGMLVLLPEAANRVPADGDNFSRVLHRIAASAIELRPEQAANSHPLTLSGVVTWSSRWSMLFYVQDSSGGIGVYRANSTESPPPPGTLVEVAGVTVMGDYAPAVQASRVTPVGRVELPPARRVTLEQALTGVEEAQRVELTGYVHRARRDRGWAVLDLTSTAGPFQARLPVDSEPGGLVGAVVALSGVCTAITNQDRRLTGVQLWLQDVAAVKVLDEGAADLEVLPLRPMQEVGQYISAADQRRRLKVEGTVVHWDPQGWVYLVDGDAWLLVQTRREESLPAGTRVQVAGFQGRSGGRTVLREAVVVPVGTGTLPAVRELAALGEADARLDGQRVAVTAQVLERYRAEGRALLALQEGRTVFEAEVLHGEQEQAMPEPGSRVRLEGVYAAVFDDQGQAVGFRLLLAAPSQVTVLAPPRWWTIERVRIAAGVALAGVLLAFAWAWTLQRRVTQQAYEINDQIRRASQLEADLQQALRLESLGSLASGVAHDFNAKLRVIGDHLAGLQAGEALSVEGQERLEHARVATIRAGDLVHRLTTLAKGGKPKPAATDLARVVAEVVAQFGLPKAIEVQHRAAGFCGRAWVDPDQFKQLLQNLLLNAMQAMPNGGALTLEVEEVMRPGAKETVLAPGRYVQLVVRDNGEGVADRNLEQVFDPYFTTREGAQGLGLAVVYAIARRNGGAVTLESKAMVGTEVKVWLPVAAE